MAKKVKSDNLTDLTDKDKQKLKEAGFTLGVHPAEKALNNLLKEFRSQHKKDLYSIAGSVWGLAVNKIEKEIQALK